MTQHMCLEVRRFCAGVGALFAAERFFSRMNQLVSLEIRSSGGGVIALCASKRLLTTMNQHMAFQTAPSITGVVALVATVGLLYVIKRLLGMFCKISFHFHIFSSQEFPKCCYARLRVN